MRNRILTKQKNSIVFRNINLIVYDFDGVLTDNKVIVREDGLESVVVNRSDGLAIGIIKEMGIKQIILSKEKNRVVAARANKLGIEVLQGIDDKKEALINYCTANDISLKEVIYFGNDINDLDVMKIVGYPVCPLDAYEEIKEVSRLVLSVPGGDGVVRDFLNYIKPIKRRTHGKSKSVYQ